jgi:hypothetical protein
MVSVLRLEVSGNQLLPYLWKKMKFNLSLHDTYVVTYKKPVPSQYQTEIDPRSN